jgi:hypothetical protein
MKQRHWVKVAAAGLVAVTTAVFLSRRKKRIGIAFGIPAEQADFVKRHRAFLAAYNGLMQVVEKVYLRSFEFAPAEQFERMLALPESDPTRNQFEHELLVKRISYYMSRSTVEDFNDILLLAANGRGIGALKILRSMYERTVNAQFVAENPSEGELFEDEFHIQQWNVIRRWLETAPAQVRARLSEEEIRGYEKLLSWSRSFASIGITFASIFMTYR